MRYSKNRRCSVTPLKGCKYVLPMAPVYKGAVPFYVEAAHTMNDNAQNGKKSSTKNESKRKRQAAAVVSASSLFLPDILMCS